jgi:nitroreductase
MSIRTGQQDRSAGPPPAGGPGHRTTLPGDARLDHRMEALEHAADQAVLAPSVHNTQPWTLVLHPDRLELRADRARQLRTLDPQGRELVESIGAALCNARVALAARGWAVEVDRLPDPAQPDLMAVVRPLPGAPEPGLPALSDAVRQRHTNRRAFTADRVPADVLDLLAAAAAAEGTRAVPVLTNAHRRLVARLTREADARQNGDPAYRAELRRWTMRRPESGDGVPASTVPHVDGSTTDEVPLRDFDTRGAGELPADTHSGADQTMVLLATGTDDPPAWLRAGEALERMLLELTRLGWVASPVTQALEVPRTRAQLRSALCGEGHPQTLIRIGHAPSTARSPRRNRAEVVRNSRREELRAPVLRRQVVPARPRTGPRPVSDGRGGTTWL